MAEKKKVVSKRKADRKAFVASRGSEKDSESRKRYYVKTRVAELEKSGKTVSPAQRKAFREKFDSGNVSRKGFAAPKKKTRVSSSARRTDSTGRSGQGATAQRDTSRNRIEGRGAYAPKTMPTRNQIEGRGAYAPPKTMPSRNQIEGRYGSSASVRKSGANAAAASRASTPRGRTDSAGRSGFGSTKPRLPTRNEIEGRGLSPRATSRNQIEGRGAYASPKTMPTRNQIEGRYGSSASVRRSGANAAAASRASTPKGRTDSAGRSGFGATKPKAPTRNQIEGRGGSSVSKGRSATSNMKGIAGYGRTDAAGRSGFGATKPKAPRGRRPEDMARGNYRIIKPKGDPNKKYEAVKPIGRPGKKYLIALAKQQDLKKKLR